MRRWLFACLFFLLSVAYSKEVPFTLEDRDRLIRMEAKVEEVNRKIDMLFNFLWIISGVFTAITVATIGFAVWDRKSAVKPFEDRFKRIEDRDRAFIESLRELARKDKKVQEILRGYSWL